MKAIILNSYVKERSTGKIAYGLYKHLKSNGHECLVCYGRGNKHPNEVDLVRLESPFAVYFHAGMARITGLQGFFSLSAAKRFIKILKEFCPDVVYLQNLHGYYIHEFKILKAIKKMGIKTIYIMMDEYPFLGKCCYYGDCTRYQVGCGECPSVRMYPKSLFFDTSRFIWKKKENIYKEFDGLVFASAPYVVSQASNSTLLRGKEFFSLDTGVDLEFYAPRECEHLRKKHSLHENAKVALCVAKYTTVGKGAQYFLEAAKTLQCKNITFIHIGFDVNNVEYPRNYIPIPYMYNQDEIAEYYSLADILICPSITDAMPNVCLEALGCGTPIAGFNCSGTPYIASQEYGTFVPKCDVQALANVISKTPRKTKKRIAECREYALSRFSSEMYFSKLEKLAIK